jgi:pimeloyl-ACP methyl ester carboxylesterase
MKRNFQMLATNGVTLRTVVEGDGPLVVLLHGWPQCWYLWRHQIDPLVAAGYRVAVPDLRGYGGSSCPPDVAAYNIRTLAADIAGLAPALGYDTFKLIGHDWGCIVAWNTALLHEDVVSAVMGLSVPFWRLGPEAIDPPGMDDRFWYIRYFQQGATADADFEANVREVLHALYYCASADAPPGSFMRQLDSPKGSRILDALPSPPAAMPAWLTSADLDYYVEQFRTSGFRGPNNFYRNIPTNNGITPELAKKRFTQPAAFAAGEFDVGLEFDPNWRGRFLAAFDDLRFDAIIAGAGHWVQMEQPAQTTALMLRFLAEC